MRKIRVDRWTGVWKEREQNSHNKCPYCLEEESNDDIINEKKERMFKRGQRKGYVNIHTCKKKKGQ
jgi:hypothetical protein